MKKPFRTFPVSAGLLEPRHVQAIDPSSPWPIFLWFLEHVTRDEPDGEGDFLGIVLHGRPVRVQQVAMELGMKERACRRHLSRLVKMGYVLQKKTGVGTCTYTVTKSKKWFYKRQPGAGRNNPSKSLEPQASLFSPDQREPRPTHQKVASGSDASTRPTHQILVRPDQKVVSAERGTRARSQLSQRSKPSPDGVGKKSTSTPSGSKVRDRGKSLSKGSNPSREISTDRGLENAAGTTAAKASSPGELILTPPASSPLKEARHAPVERFIKSTYQEANDGVDCAWNGRAGKALKDFLAEHSSSSWPIERITQCVANRFKSDGVSLSADPHSWISDLASFLNGPKDKYGKTRAELATAPKIKAPRPVENIPPLIAQPDKVKAMEGWKQPISRVVRDDESLDSRDEPLAIGRLQ
jgi:hypothetical protein